VTYAALSHRTFRSIVVALYLTCSALLLSGCGPHGDPTVSWADLYGNGASSNGGGGSGGGGGGSGGGGGGGGSGGGGGGGGGTPPPPGPYPPPPPPTAPPPPPPTDGLTFKWTVDGVEKLPPAFVPAPGPGGNAGNLVSRLQLTSEVSLVIWRRFSPSSPVSLVEVGIFNDPLNCTTQQGGAGGVIPSVTMPDIGIFCFNGKMYPLLPTLSTWIPVNFGDSYYMNFGNPDWRKFCDGSGYVWPFLVTTNLAGSQPTFNDLTPLFPANPGSMWTAVDPAFPSHPANDMNAVTNGFTPFNNTGDPWVLQGLDEKPVAQAGFHGDWPWCHVGAYYTQNDLNDLLYIVPPVYRQAARQIHYNGFSSASSALGEYMFLLSRPAIWGSKYLGRVPTGAVTIAPQADNHGWTGPDHEHASIRRVGEYAESTGSPWAWQEVLHYGQLVKPMLRSIDPQGGFPDTTRAYLAWLEVAYRCYRLDPTFDMTYPMECIERWLDRSRTFDWDGAGPFVPGWGQPQPLNMLIAYSWFPGVYASASFEDCRFIPILLKVGQLFNRPKMIQAALETAQWYNTVGWSDGPTYPVGVKVIVAINGNAVGLGSAPADLVGYARADGLGFYLAGKYLQANPNPLYNGALFLQHAKQIKDTSVTQPNYQSDLAGYLPWVPY